MSSSCSWSSSDGDDNDCAASFWSDANDAAKAVAGEASPESATRGCCAEEGTLAGGGVVDGVEGARPLEPRERIHRCIDRCIPPALLAHQRATDGTVMAQLCAELEAFGAPDAWATQVPATVFEEYEATAEEDARDNEPSGSASAALQAGPQVNLFEAALYSCESVAYPSHPSVVELRRTAKSGRGSTASWSTLVRHLSYLTVRLHSLLSAPHGGVGAYVLPLRFQALVVPLLYAWATHWPLIEADIECWQAVLQCFHVACRPPKPDRAAADTDSEAAVRAPFTLPWQPLAALCLSTRDEQNAELPSWRSTLTAVVTSLPSLCRRASPHFTPDAVDGLWGLVAGQLAPTEDGVAALSLFVRLVPYRHLCQPKTDVAAAQGSAEKEVTRVREEDGRQSQGQQRDGLESIPAAAALPQLTARAKQILRFLLVEAATWEPPGRPSPVVEPSSDKGNRSKPSAHSFYLTWGVAVMTFVGLLARAHPGVTGMDAFAEPLFTAWLQALQLPAGKSGALPDGSTATVSHLLRSGGHEADSLHGRRTVRSGSEAGSLASYWTAAPYARLLNAFPDDCDSPLWRHLERWLHATSVLVRPGMPCKRGSPADRVCDCYTALAREAARRCVLKERGATCELHPSRGEAVEVGAGAPAKSSSGGSAADSATGAVPHRWSPATVGRFVSLLLPHAVAAFQARARQAQLFLCALLRLSPERVLPHVLSCVRTGVDSPTQVAVQRAASTLLLTGAVPTLLASATAASLLSTSASSATLLAFLRETLPQLLALVNPSDLVSSMPVLSLVAVATGYAAAEEVFGSAVEVDAFAKAYTARALPLFAAHADANNGHFACAEVMFRAFLRTLPHPALSTVTREVLREAVSRDHGARMTGLVRMVAACAPAEAWACAQKHWLRVLLDLSARDAEVEWAASLLAACLADLGDRSLARTHAAAIWRGVQLQLCFLTSKRRRGAAAQVMEALMTSLMRPRESAACHVCMANGSHPAPQRLPKAEEDRCAAGLPATSTPLLPRVGTAAEARVYVDWPAAEDVQVAVDLFNASLKDCVRVIADVNGGGLLNTAATETAAAVSGDGDISVHARFFANAATAAAERSGGPASHACESAAAVTRQTVLEGTLDWMLRLLCECEWIFIEATPTAEAADPEQMRGVPWWDVNLHVAWCPTGAPLRPAACRPAYTRTELFEVLYRCVCLPMLHQHVVDPLRKCGVELTERFGVPPTEGVSMQTDESLADVTGLLKLLQWLSSSVVRLPQQRWRPAASFSHYLRQSLRNQCPWVRRRLPLACWVDWSLQLQLEAVTRGHLPVAQRTFSAVVAVLQCLSFSPRRSVWEGAIRLLVHVRLFGALDSASLTIFEGRVRAVATAVISQWRASVATSAPEVPEAKVTLRPQEQPLLCGTISPAQGSSADGQNGVGQPSTKVAAVLIGVAPSMTQRLHTLQGALEGVQRLLVSLALSREFFEAPSMCIESLRFLTRFPEELRSPTAGLLLPQLTERVRSAKGFLPTGAVRSPSFAGSLVHVAHGLASTYPARAVLLVAYAHLVYWPSPHRLVSLRAVRRLTRLTLSSHVVLRCVAADLLQAVSLPVTVREPMWTVCALPDGLSVPPSFSLSPDAVKETLSETEQRTHQEAVAAVKDCLHRLTEACPLMPYYVGTAGLVFPLSYLTLPRCAAAELGLYPAHAGAELASHHWNPITGRAFMDTATYARPSDAVAYRRAWQTALLGDMSRDGGDVAVQDAEGGSSCDADAAAQQLSPHAWVRQLLALPVECSQGHHDRQVTSPITVVKLLASLPRESVSDDASLSWSPAASVLLAWADDELQMWRCSRQQNNQPRSEDGLCASAAGANHGDGHSASCAQRGTADAPPAHLSGEGAENLRAATLAGAEESREIEEDKMYRLFRSLAIVSSAVLRLTVPLQPAVRARAAKKGPADTGLRARAVRFFSDIIACVCSYAAVPHRVAQRVMLVAFTTLGASVTSEELWTIVYALLGEVCSTASVERAAAAADDASRGGDDTWSQQQQRLLSFIAALFRGMPPAVICASLPRLAALLETHADLFRSSAVHVRQMAAAVVAQLIAFSPLQSSLRAEFSGCRASADALVVLLMRRADSTVFRGRLPLLCGGTGGKGDPGKVMPTACGAPTVASDETPNSADVVSPTTQDAALLTFTMLCLQQSTVDLLEAHASDMVLLLCCCLDLFFTEVQRVHKAAEMTLAYLIARRMPKALVHGLVEQLCRVCTGSVAYGASRRAKAACACALGRLIFPNLHRIGKFAIMEEIAAASLAALAHRDAGVRAEGSHLMAVLTKVAAEAQTRVLVQRLAQELRQHPRDAAAEHQREEAPSIAGAGAACVGRRVALVQALGAVVLADPGDLSSYVPKVMVQLAFFAREGNTECGRVAKRVFEEWWHAHREGWEHVYKSRFTPQQVDAMSELLLAPRYYA
ncbi:hypothetical protein LSCM1_07363 [Leishmania martiniquensis]|uniref:Proteasome activator complex subunit 4 C-terminal domain-containing protein n=1 Tax=Leishmania martiniquensis TaxID=1580590 RepID=A0A836H3K8_9TRYP|nr:hypothetical protein LSCM1_07363 [Leishmania martiniquensis]